MLEQMGLDGDSVLALQGIMGKVPGWLRTNAISVASPICYSPAEESAPNHSCQSPSPASQDGEEEKEGASFPERMVPARNAKLQDPPIGPRPPKPVAVPRGRRAPQVPGGREETESGAAPGANKPRLRLGSQQDQEEPEGQGPSDQGRRTAPLKPKRTRRAQSCDKLEPDRRRPPDPTGVCGETGPLPTDLSNMAPSSPNSGGWLSLPRKQASLNLSSAGTSEPGTD